MRSYCKRMNRCNECIIKSCFKFFPSCQSLLCLLYERKKISFLQFFYQIILSFTMKSASSAPPLILAQFVHSRFCAFSRFFPAHRTFTLIAASNRRSSKCEGRKRGKVWRLKKQNRTVSPSGSGLFRCMSALKNRDSNPEDSCNLFSSR